MTMMITPEEEITMLKEEIQNLEHRIKAELEPANRLLYSIACKEGDLYQALLSTAKDLVEQLEVVHNSDEYKGVWALYDIHGLRYNGPQYKYQLQELKSVLESIEESGGVSEQDE